MDDVAAPVCEVLFLEGNPQKCRRRAMYDVQFQEGADIRVCHECAALTKGVRWRGVGEKEWREGRPC